MHGLLPSLVRRQSRGEAAQKAADEIGTTDSAVRCGVGQISEALEREICRGGERLRPPVIFPAVHRRRPRTATHASNVVDALSKPECAQALQLAERGNVRPRATSGDAHGRLRRACGSFSHH